MPQPLLPSLQLPRWLIGFLLYPASEASSPPSRCLLLRPQKVEIVLTAHPTQVNRRTLQYKHTHLAQLLDTNDRPDLTAEEKEHIIEELVRPRPRPP